MDLKSRDFSRPGKVGIMLFRVGGGGGEREGFHSRVAIISMDITRKIPAVTCR